MAQRVPPAGGRLSTAVVDAIADYRGVDPAAMDRPMYDVVDLEALDTLFRGDTGVVSFEYDGLRVAVDYAGTVDLEPVDPDDG